MLSTTVEPECLQRPFVTSYAMIGPRSGLAANIIGPPTAVGAGADGAPERAVPNALAHSTIHPAADRVDGYGATARANSPAVY
jgi:hypothetical protein